MPVASVQEHLVFEGLSGEPVNLRWIFYEHEMMSHEQGPPPSSSRNCWGKRRSAVLQQEKGQ